MDARLELRVVSDGAAVLSGEGIIADNAPDDDVLAECRRRAGGVV